MARELPSGIVTFVFTDVEGSTKLLHDLGPDAYAKALNEHRRVLREAFATGGGVEVDTQGDAFFYAFPTAQGALAAAGAATEALKTGPIRVRIGLHTGAAHLAEGGYVGEDVHLGARVAAAAHGGQVLLSKATRDLVDEELLDLGEHRVKDFAEPVWIFQLGSERFPPLRTISNTNLPRPASSFIGRDHEVGELTRLLRDSARLVTLTGPGGSGKTRLAIEAAVELVPEFRNGVFWIALAPLRDSTLVAPTIAQTLGATDGLAEHIGERELLLLVDNLEQVIEAAPELATLVEACPNLRLLVTSRERLRVRGEVEYPVSPLVEPDAVALFCERSRLQPDATIAQLCRRLDSLPLAVELAAARTNLLSPQQILERLSQRLDLLGGGRDAQARQQTLRATIEWSYELLGENERSLFAHLAVFSGGCTVEAAEKVVDADLDTIQALVDKNLVNVRAERVWMLETIRDYAAERLAERDDAETRRRLHADFFLALAETAAPALAGPDQLRWLPRVLEEQDNLRSALDWAFAGGDPSVGIRIALSLRDFWHIRSSLAEATRWYDRALVHTDAVSSAMKADVLWSAGWFRFEAFDFVAAEALYDRSLELYRDEGDRGGEAWVLTLKSLVAEGVGDFKGAFAALEEALGRRDAVADPRRGRMLHFLGEVAVRCGDAQRGELLLRDALERVQSDRDDAHAAEIIHGLGDLALVAGDYGEAETRFREALNASVAVGHEAVAAYCLSGLAAIAGARADADSAGRFWGGAERLQELIGPRVLPRDRARYERYLARVAEDDAFAAAVARSSGSTVEEVVGDALQAGVLRA